MPPKAARKSAVNSPPPLIPAPPQNKIDRGAETAGIWAKRRILIAVGGTALLAVCLTIVAIIFFAANHTPEEERLQLVGTWRFDGSNESLMAELSEKFEKQNEVLALDKEQKGLILDAMKAKIRESLFNCTLELQREGVAIMTVPRLKRDGSDALVETGTWEVAGSKSELELRLSYGQKGIWGPIRFDSDDQFTQIFPSHTLAHYRQF